MDEKISTNQKQNVRSVFLDLADPNSTVNSGTSTSDRVTTAWYNTAEDAMRNAFYNNPIRESDIYGTGGPVGVTPLPPDNPGPIGQEGPFGDPITQEELEDYMEMEKVMEEYKTAKKQSFDLKSKRKPTTLTTLDWEEIKLRERSIEMTCSAFGNKEVTLQEFSDLLDAIYNYLKFGKKVTI